VISEHETKHVKTHNRTT